MEWKLINTAPFDRDLELAVIDPESTHLVAFPCRRVTDSGWIDVETGRQICFYYTHPTHWRDWLPN